MIAKQVTFIAQSGHEEALRLLLSDMVLPSRAEPGCLRYDIYEMAKVPGHFVVVEAWEDEAALEGHKESEHYRYYKANYEVHTAEKYSEDLLPLFETF
jgi:quinol monooxygenase YgiN